jgi:hypothetical protein
MNIIAHLEPYNPMVNYSTFFDKALIAEATKKDKKEGQA